MNAGKKYFGLFVYQNLRTGICLIVSLVHYFISKVRNLATRPSSCIDCRSTYLKDDAVLATTGTSEKYADYVPSVLCLSCETLMIITPNPGPVVGINHSVGNQVTVRNS